MDIFGCKLLIDDSLPPGTLEMRSPDGRLLGRIVNIGDGMTHVFAIRLKGSTKYLPGLKGSRVRTRGFSHTEPVDGPPRLFYTVQSARNALTAWLQGTWVQSTTRSGFYGEDEDVYVEPKAVAGRSRESMEIVEFELKEIGVQR